MFWYKLPLKHTRLPIIEISDDCFLVWVSSALIVICIRFVVVVTRSKAVDLQKKQTSRSVFQCYVFGPPGVGKVRTKLTVSSSVVICHGPTRTRMKSAGKLGTINI